jgi:GNAT superfamily N-acetyltransferase
MTASGFALVPAETLSPAATAQLKAIYEEGFPPHQRDDFAAVTSQRQDGELALALVSDGRAAGFAMLRPLGRTGWVYLRYFVVDRDQRGQGLGGLLWDQLTAELGRAGFTLLVFDVDDPDETGCEPAEVPVRHSRIRFYQRHGANLLPVTGYRTPDTGAGATSWTPMLLMAASLSGRPAAPEAGQVRDIVDAVYRFRWQLEPDQD